MIWVVRWCLDLFCKKLNAFSYRKETDRQAYRQRRREKRLRGERERRQREGERERGGGRELENG